MTTYAYGHTFVSVKQMTLKQARDWKGWSQEQLEAATAALAEKSPNVYVTVDQRNISKIENGAIVDPRNSTVLTLETALEVRRGTLVFGQREAVAS